MSLINKMLVDLDLRKDGEAVVHAPIYNDLRPAAGGPRAAATTRYRLPIIAAASAILLGTAYWLYTPGTESPVVRAPAAPAERIALAPKTPVGEVASPPTVPQLAAPGAVATTPPAELVQNAPVQRAPVQMGSAAAPIAPVGAPVTAVIPSADPATTTQRASTPTPTPAGVAMTPAPAAVKTPPALTTPARVSVAKTTDAASTGVAKTPNAANIAAQPSAGEPKFEKKTRVLTPRERAEELHRIASTQRSRGASSLAETNWRAALAAAGDFTPARAGLIGLVLASGRTDDAVALLQDGLQRTPAHYAFAQSLARLYVEQGNDAQALATLEASRAHATRDAEYQGFLAALYQRAQRYADAATAYDAALALRPQEPKWWVGSGIVREAQGDMAGAEAAYRRAQANPMLPVALSRFVQERLAALKSRAS